MVYVEIKNREKQIFTTAKAGSFLTNCGWGCQKALDRLAQSAELQSFHSVRFRPRYGKAT